MPTLARAALDRGCSAAAEVAADTMRALYEDVREQAETYMELFPEDQEVCCFLALANRQLGNEDELVIVALKALALAPRSKKAELARALLGDVSLEKIDTVIGGRV
jgi:hypothetical protein